MDSERTLTLDDGRRLGLALAGDPAGRPVLVCHGWPGSRRVAALLDPAAQAAGIRLVAWDRPGIGGSDPHPGRTLVSGAADAAAVADRLGIDRFGVVGLSGGGPYALALGARLGPRLTGIVLGSPMGPLETAADRAVLPPHLRAVFDLSRRAPGIFGLPLSSLALAPRLGARLILTELRLLAAPPDRALLADARLAAGLAAEYAAALAQGGGALAAEVAIYNAPWGFRLEDVAVPVCATHGALDRNVPLAWAARAIAPLPRGAWRVLPDAGHFWFLARDADLFHSAHFTL